MTSFAPGWYPDPEAEGGIRWWDGSAWSAHRQAPGAIHSYAPPVAVLSYGSAAHPFVGAPAYSINSTRAYARGHAQSYNALGGTTALWEPLYGATAGQAFSRFWKKYADFSGRASRSEFWWAYLWTVVLGAGSYILLVVVVFGIMAAADAAASPTGLNAIAVVFALLWFVAYLGMIVPTIAIAVRRLHDVGMSGLLYLIAFVPFGSLVLLCFWLMDSKPEGVKYDRPR